MGEKGSARTLIDSLATDFTVSEIELPEVAGPDGPIGWQDYDAAKARAVERTGERESVVCGVGRIGDTEAVLIAFEFGFLGGSVGGHTGLLVEAAFARAAELRLPVVSLIATGGSRMQEGMRALSQLQRMARASDAVRVAGLPRIAVLRNPTTGGGWATLGAGADVSLGLVGAQVGFAGSRVRPDGDASDYTAEGQLAAGHIDQVVAPDALPATLRRWLTLLTSGGREPAKVPDALSAHTGLPETGWDAVRRAR
ncbi:MAG: carboxyl transferase domain-containing protein, partial [Haloechinothrix sp.]